VPFDKDILDVLLLSVYAALLGVAALYDLWKFRIPNAIVVGLVVLFLAAALKSYDTVPWLSHLGAGALMFAAGTAVYYRGFLGGGDVKLLAATSLWIGFERLLLEYLVSVAVIGGALSLLLIALRWIVQISLLRIASRPELITLHRLLVPGESIPYGVAIAVGAIPVMWSMPLLGAP
jgi:prepilin peptidase CpaA